MNVLGKSQVPTWCLTCYKTLGACYLACYVPIDTHNMGGYGCKWHGERIKVCNRRHRNKSVEMGTSWENVVKEDQASFDIFTA